MRIVWRGRELISHVQDTLANRMEALGALMVADIRDDISTPGPTKTHPGYSASAPGEPPHRRSGQLRRSITSELQRGRIPVLRVGSNLKYAKWLELGTERMPGGRPFLRPALMRARRDIARILRRRR